LRVADVDVLDGTPLLDIKPYVPDCDVFTVEHVGWHARARGTRIADDHSAKGAENEST